jgi:hypothetical protein
MPKQFQTALGAVTTEPCPMGELKERDRFVGPDGMTVYAVTGECASHKNGWLFVRDLSMTDQQARQLVAEPGAVEEGCDPRDGMFTYATDTLLDRIV